MTSERWPVPSSEELEGRKRELLGRTRRWAVTGTGLGVLGLGGLLLAERAGVAWLTVCLAALLCVSWGWALLALFLGWGGLLLGMVAAGMGQVVAAARTHIENGSENRGGGGLD
ncbi:hypothetical protein OCAE111667_09245 [Occultella aeris]|uniref:Uncharacterized protein n=1 Tax=Occultella aeris TaxID=2761496 RepID=A0A7M4DJT2_9MICO|nr:hypothetical protein [Occultella aeris]VZO37317.1 hypothetical protein HALOF300_02390 [Occultella aeris]